MSRTLSRRGFLVAGGAAAAARRALGAGDRIRIGIIGVGGHGFGNHLKWLVARRKEENIEVTAVADVYQRRVNRAVAAAQGAEGYLDYRRLLESSNVDAVVIATPDHWHARISIDAMQAGKHVYCEKPMTLTIEQAFAVRDAVHRTKKVYTVGPQGTANAAYWQANAAINEGRIGKVMYAQGGGGRAERIHTYDHWKIDPGTGPDRSGDDYIDWDMFLGWRFGLAPKIPFTPEHYFRFRKYWPYSGGQASDLLYHSLAPMLLALAGPDGAYPRRVTAGGGLYAFKDGRDIPDVYVTSLDYPGEYTVVLVNSLAAGVKMPAMICGRHGHMDFTEVRTPPGRPHDQTSDLRLHAERDFIPEFKEKNGNYSDVEIPVEPRRDIMGSFFDAIRGVGTVTCNVELGTATMVGIRLGVDAYRQNKTMLWNAASRSAES